MKGDVRATDATPPARVPLPDGSPFLAGRRRRPRLPLVGGVELLPDTTLPVRLLSLRRHEQHVFLRYALR